MGEEGKGRTYELGKRCLLQLKGDGRPWVEEKN